MSSWTFKIMRMMVCNVDVVYIGNGGDDSVYDVAKRGGQDLYNNDGDVLAGRLCLGGGPQKK
ncbi:hypothetical protein DOY81_010914 [Sarcophaga bullata]|nr:hypothetical protein DOY81_010914 [Sarcophaga bullata]